MIWTVDKERLAMKRKILVITLLFSVIVISLGLSYLSPAIAANNNSPVLDIDQTYIIESDGGNLYIYYNVKILNLTNTPPQFIEFRFPNEFFANDSYIYSKAYTSKNNNLPLKTLEKENYTSFIVSTSNLEVKNKESSFRFIIYVPLHVHQEKRFEYIFRLVEYPATNLPINHTTVSIEIPIYTKPSKVPKGLLLTQIASAGAKPQQYEITGKFTSEEITYSNGLPNVYTITLEDLNVPHPQIYLFSGEENISITIYPDGKVYYQYIYTLRNLGKDAISKDDEITLRKIEGTVNVGVESLLNRTLKTEEEGNIIYVKPSYIVLPNNILQFKAVYQVDNGVSNKGLLGENIAYDLPIEPTTNFFISKAVVLVRDPSGKIMNKEVYYNMTRFSKNILHGETRINLFSVARENVYIQITIATIALFGLSITIYRGYALLGYRRLPEEVNIFIKQLKKETVIMDNLIKLEDRYLRREIKGKEYLRRRAELVRSLRKEVRETDKLKNSVKRIAEHNKRISDILKLTQDMKDKWNELRELEEKFLNRKISPEEYTRSRKKLLIEFQAFIRKIESII